MAKEENYDTDSNFPLFLHL